MNSFDDGKRAFDKGNFQQALILFEDAIKCEPNKSVIWYFRGLSCHKLKKYAEALKCFNEALKIKPDHVKSLVEKGLMFKFLRKFQDAIDSLDNAIAIDPNYDEAWSVKGEVFLEKKELKKAIEFLDKALRLNKKNSNTWNSKGAVYTEQKKLKKALKCFNNAIRLDSNDSKIWNNKGIIHEEKCEFKKALKCFDKAIKLDPNRSDFWTSKANTYCKMGAFKNSLKCCDEASKIEPSNAAPWYIKLTVYFNSNLFHLAISCLYRFVFLNERNNVSYKYYSNKLLTFADNNHKLKLVEKISNRFNDWSACLFSCSIISKQMARIKTLKQIETIEIERNVNKATQTRYKALICYLLGYPPDTYELFNNKFKSHEHSTLNMQDWYYFLQSAMDFYEPYESILAHALNIAEITLKKKEAALIELYYAGQVYLLIEDEVNSITAFSKSIKFLPSLYMYTFLVKENEQQYKSLCKEILQRDLIDKQNGKKSYLHGFYCVSIYKEEIYTVITDYAIGIEIAEAVSEIRESLVEYEFINEEKLGNYNFFEPWEIVSIRPEKLEIYYKEYRNIIIDNLKNQILLKIEKRDTNEYHKTEMELFDANDLDEINSLNSIFKKCEKEDKVEIELGKLIQVHYNSISLIKVNHLLNYFWLVKKINLEEKISLLTFAYVLKSFKSPKINKILPEIIACTVTGLASNFVGFGHVFSSFVAAFTGVITKEIIDQINKDELQTFKSMLKRIQTWHDEQAISKINKGVHFFYPEFREIVWDYIWDIKENLQGNFNEEFLEKL